MNMHGNRHGNTGTTAALACLAALAAAVAGIGAPAATAATGPGLRIASVATGGAASDGFSEDQAVSADGHYVAFASLATNLVPGDTNGAEDLFVRDLARGLTRRASLDTAGEQSNGTTVSQPALSEDGRYVAFTSDAGNLVAGDTNGALDVFVRDLRYGITTRASLAADGAQLAAGSIDASISWDGRYVLFSTSAAAVPEDTNGTVDVYVRDLRRGTTRRASVATDGTQGNSASMTDAISGDGRYVAFTSYASNLVPNDTNGTTDVFRHDLRTGATVRVSVGPGGRQSGGGLHGGFGSGGPSLSENGRMVAFYSYAGGLVDGPRGIADVYVRDVKAGTTTMADLGPTGMPSDTPATSASISGDGRWVGFGTWAANLVPGDTNGQSDGFVRDLEKGVTRRVTLGDSGQQGNDLSGNPVLDEDGEVAVFASSATNLVPGDANGQADVFVARLK
jgi:Tol biopolymer transport system component